MTASETSSAALWHEYAAAPDTHRNIPNGSYAGFRAGEAPIPDPPVAANVRDCGARGDGLADDTPAFDAAIRQAKAAGGGAVFVPSGRYRLTGLVRLDCSGLVLRGENRDRTVLAFERPLVDAAAGGRNDTTGITRWSWSGGLVWVGPEADWLSPGSAAPEGWLGAGRPQPVSGPARRGDRTLPLEAPAAAGLRPGMPVLITWENPADNSLLLFLAGHERMRQYPWKEHMGRTAGRRWRWVARLAAVEGDAVTLDQPLRTDIRPEWKATIEPLGAHVERSGVERLTLDMPEHERQSHCKDLGFNGLYFSRAVDCWTRGLAVIHADNAINLSACKNVTVSDFVLRGGHQHHATTARTESHDNLFTDFRIESEPFHGLNSEGLSSGNVWRRGVMRHGTFDYHRGLTYESIKTDIDLSNDGRPGGNLSAGPRMGARCVHWNIRVTRRESCSPAMPGCPPLAIAPGKVVYQPDLISDGALVGIQGIEPCLDEAWEAHGVPDVTPGDKNCRVADHGRIPDPPDLYQAQMNLRLRSSLAHVLTIPGRVRT